jgi:hypothetical protein
MAVFIGSKSAVNSVYSTKNIPEDCLTIGSHCLNNSVTPDEWVVSTDQTTQCHTCWMSCSHCSNKCHNCWMSGSHCSNNIASHSTKLNSQLHHCENLKSHKSTGTAVPVYTVKAYGKQRYSSTHSLPWHNTKLSGQLQAPAPLTLRKEPMGPRTGLDVLVNLLPLLGFEPSRHHPACSRSLVTSDYTSYAVMAALVIYCSEYWLKARLC